VLTAADQSRAAAIVFWFSGQCDRGVGRGRVPASFASYRAASDERSTSLNRVRRDLDTPI
jgi:hypothetical protein